VDIVLVKRGEKRAIHQRFGRLGSASS
jgi:hypothetical protein